MTQAPTETSISTSDIRDILAAHIRVQVDVYSIREDQDLYSAGLTSLSTVGLMLALEDRFDVEFPDSMLGRATFRSIASIAEAVTKLAK